MKHLAIVAVLAVTACNDSGDNVSGATTGGAPAPNGEAPAAEVKAVEPTAEVTARVVTTDGKQYFELTASAPEPFHLKNTTPFSVVLRGSDGVEITKTQLNRDDYVSPDAPSKTVITPIHAAPGEHIIDADAELYVCSAELCKQVVQHLHTQFTTPGS